MPTATPTCTAKTLGASRASNPGLAADCDALLAIRSTLRVSGWIDYDTPLLWDHSYALNWSARTPLTHWRTVTLGGTPLRVTGLDFGDTRESVKVYNARTRQWAEGQPYTREWTLRGVIPTQLGSLTALETLDLGGSELTGAVPTQLGNLARLRTLDLSNNRLTGELPEALDALTALTRVRVAGNAFTRCAPHGLWGAASHDLATLGLPDCRPTVSYGAPQTTGVVDAPGEYAFFTATGTAITTYEGLREDVARLTIHEQDTAGASWAWFYDGVEAGDAFEWRKANDCWVRYVVDEVLADPSATLKALSVEWMTYAFTGCSGAVPASVRGSMNWGALPDLGGASLTVPIRHGPFQVLPDGWTGATAPGETYALPDEAPPYPGPVVYTKDLSVARGFPYWRDPVVPAGWTFRYARSGGYAVSYGYCAGWVNARGVGGVDICGDHLAGTVRADASWLVTGENPRSLLRIVHETRTIAGRPAIILYSPRGLHHHRSVAITVRIYDAVAGSEYTILSGDGTLRGSNIEGMIAIARSLFGEVAAQPRATACTDAALGGSRAGNAGLAADCDALLAARDALAGGGALNWSAGTALAEWDGVTVSGVPPRVVGLDLRARGLRGSVPTQLGALTKLRTLDLSNNRLTGELPKELDDLDALGWVWLAGNGFTGCAPAELWRITSHDLDALGLPNCKPPLTYGAPSRTGIVDAPGEHTFFTNRGPALTYEALRNDVIRMVIHKRDAGGVSRDAIYDDVEAGDDFEWREADDCWVRYLVERVLPDPTDIPLKVLAVRRYGYAYTGCSGMVSQTGSRTLTWVPPNIRGPDITVPVRHGPVLLTPMNWKDSIEEPVRLNPQPIGVTPQSPSSLRTTSIREARAIPLWRDVELPASDWWFGEAWAGTYDSPPYGHGFKASYGNERGYIAVDVLVGHMMVAPDQEVAHYPGHTVIQEARIIDGYPSLLRFDPGSGNPRAQTSVLIFDEDSGIVYASYGYSGELIGRNIEPLVEITRSLYRENEE